MLTIVTSIKTFRVDIRATEQLLDIPKLGTSRLRMVWCYVPCCELEAALQGLPHSPHLLEVVRTCITGDTPFTEQYDESFTFACTDGPLTVSLSKHTLARHFLQVRGFIETHPDEAMPIAVTRGDMTPVLRSMVGGLTSPPTLNERLLYVLQLLTPATDLFYFLMTLDLQPHAVMQMIRGLTPEDRCSVLDAYEQDCLLRLNNLDIILPLPERGQGDCVAYALNSVVLYKMQHDVPELSKYPSWDFLRASLCVRDARELKNLLFQHEYSDTSVPLHPLTEQYLVRVLASLVSECDWTECTKLLGMLGVDVGGKSGGYAPFQVTLSCNKLGKTDRMQLVCTVASLSGLTYCETMDLLDS